jgi:DNA repair protein RecO (recombination protein O)
MANKERFSNPFIVLSITRYKDDSAIVSLAGNMGVVSCLVKGVYRVKSPLKSLLFTGNILMVEYSHLNDGLLFAYSTKLIFDASPLLSDLNASSFLFFLEEISLSLFHYGDTFPFEEVFSILKGFSDRKDSLSLSLLFLGSIYRSLGLEVNIRNCIRCGRNHGIVSYSLREGGFLCRDCLSEEDEKKDDMDLYVLKFAFSHVDTHMVSKVVPKRNGLKVITDLYQHLMEYFDLKGLKSFAFLLKNLSDDL